MYSKSSPSACVLNLNWMMHWHYVCIIHQVEQVAVLAAFIDAEVTFHQQSLDLLLSLAEVIKTK